MGEPVKALLLSGLVLLIGACGSEATAQETASPTATVEPAASTDTEILELEARIEMLERCIVALADAVESHRHGVTDAYGGLDAGDVYFNERGWSRYATVQERIAPECPLFEPQLIPTIVPITPVASK